MEILARQFHIFFINTVMKSVLNIYCQLLSISYEVFES